MSAVRITAKRGFLQFMMPQPIAVIDGAEHPLVWNEAVTIPLAPGPHDVTISFRYLGRQCGVASTTAVATDPPAPLLYKAPFAVTMAGKLTAG